MWLPVSTIAAICVLFDACETSNSNNDLEIAFRERTDSDWKNAWHKEKYSRCRETLIRHLYWACEKDIYRLTRRSDPSYKYYNDNELDYPWLVPNKAKRLLRFRRNINRRSGSSITNECCKSSGCTWEEYAEYCPTNKRYTSYI
ncbi:probable insulin-like peptide 7 [Anoplophora glabripennis]|uniref:probable insulin-like peptide 7 n=1 Tax=Anoplophora glabripennis TaxID=217634 RepID=UPI000875477A|nr:probable insulin-like peptide 7 [Anoplophora glabripennis]